MVMEKVMIAAYLGVGVLGLAGSLRGIFNTLVGHCSDAERCWLECGGEGGPSEGVSGD